MIVCVNDLILSIWPVVSIPAIISYFLGISTESLLQTFVRVAKSSTLICGHTSVTEGKRQVVASVLLLPSCFVRSVRMFDVMNKKM